MAVPAVKESNAPAEAATSSNEAPLFDVGFDRTEMGKPDSFRYNISCWILEERYDRAIEELKEFLEKDSEYPNFKDKVGRYVSHSIDLIYAIKAKRSFPGINSLTRAKQQELREKFKGHFKELQNILKIIEKIQTDLRIQDVRSTIYVVKALWIAGLAIVLLAFWLDVYHGLAKTSWVVFDDTFGQVANWLADKTGF